MDIVKMIHITETLRSCREQQIFLGGLEKWQKTVAQWQPIFEAVMKKHDCNLMQATIILIERAQEDPDCGILTHLLAGVACELAEPTSNMKESTSPKLTEPSQERPTDETHVDI